MSDMRALWNAIERVAIIDHVLAEDAYNAANSIRDAIYVRASSEGVNGGCVLAERAAREAIEASKARAAIAARVESGELNRVALSHSGEGCCHCIGTVRAKSSRRMLRLLQAGRIPRWMRTEYARAVDACDEGDVYFSIVIDRSLVDDLDEITADGGFNYETLRSD